MKYFIVLWFVFFLGLVVFSGFKYYSTGAYKLQRGCNCKENDGYNAGGLTGMGVGWEQAAGIWPK